MHPDQLRKTVKEKSIAYITTGMIDNFGCTLSTVLGYLMKEEDYAIKMCKVKEEEYDPKGFIITISKGLAMLELSVTEKTLHGHINKLEKRDAIQVVNWKKSQFKINWDKLEEII